jgi:LacI family transcriptional regulator
MGHDERRAGQRKPPTIIDVARTAQVGVGTVSRVLNRHPKVAPDMRARVLRAIERIGFQPNSVARSMRLRETRAVGCIVTDIAQPIAAELLSGAEQEFWKAGYAVLIADTRQEQRREQDILDFMRERRIDGLIGVTSDDTDPATVRRLRALRIPIVLWERDVGPEIDAVLTDHGGGAAAATRHLLELGHREIAIVVAHRGTWPGREQARGFHAAFAAAGLAAPPRLYSADTFDIAAASRLLGEADRPTAVIANIHHLPFLLRVCRELDLSVPRDVSLVSIGDSETLEAFSPPTTAVRGNARDVGASAARRLLDLLADGRRTDRSRIVFPTELVIRQSCARCVDALAPQSPVR